MKKLYLFICIFLINTAFSNNLNIKKGDLVFDVGAFRGEKAEIYLKKKAKVICVEPNPYYVSFLQERFRDNKNVLSIVPKGLGEKEDELILNVDNGPLSTFSNKFQTGRFKGGLWEKKVKVPITTLDDLINTYGTPKFCKIDVEGFEYPVLLGLTKKIPMLSFEFHIEFLDETIKCINRLAELGYTKFNYTTGENTKFILFKWVSAEKLISHLKQKPNDFQLWGDIYVRSK